MNKSILKFAVLSIIFTMALSVNYLFAAWTGPTEAPPEGNTPKPIHVGTAEQVKDGKLGLNSLAVFGEGYFQGNVGIGIEPTTHALQINNLGDSNAYSASLRLLKEYSGQTDGGPGIQFDNLDGILGMVYGFADSSGTGGGLSFFTSDDGTTATRKMRINKDGNVGIGIGEITPLTRLDIHSPGVASNESVIKLENPSLDAYSSAQIDINSGASVRAQVIGQRAGLGDGGFFIVNTADNDGIMQERLRITNTGDFGIGTTSPGARLDINGSIRVGDMGTIISKIQLGHIGDGTQGSAGTSGSVTFVSAFDSAPRVFLQVEDLNLTQIPTIFVTAVSTTGFSWSASTYSADAFSWLAIGE